MGQPTFTKPTTKPWLLWMSYGPSEEQHHCVEPWMKRGFLCGKRKSLCWGLQPWKRRWRLQPVFGADDRGLSKPCYFPQYKKTATQKYSWSILNQKQVPRRLHVCENNPAGHFHTNVSSSCSCSAFDVEADFNRWVYISLGHRGFSISSWILLHKVFFVYGKVEELAPCEPVKFIKPARTKLFWLLLRK